MASRTFARVGNVQKQLELGGIGGHHPQSAPARDLELLLDQAEQAIVQQREHLRGEFVSGLGKGLSTYSAGQIGLLAEVGEQGIQFILDAGLEAGEDEGDLGGKRQFPIGAKGFGIEAGGIVKFGGNKQLAESDTNTQEITKP